MLMDSQGSGSGSSPVGGWAVPLAEQEGPHLGTSEGSKVGTCEKAQGVVTRPLSHGWAGPCLAQSHPGCQGKGCTLGQAPSARGPRVGRAAHRHSDPRGAKASVRARLPQGHAQVGRQALLPYNVYEDGTSPTNLSSSAGLLSSQGP